MKTKLIIIATVVVIGAVAVLHSGNHPMQGHCLKNAGTVVAAKK